MGKISDIAVSYYGANALQKAAFCVGYTRALSDMVVELSDTQDSKDVQKLMQAWLNAAQELQQELQELQTYKEDKP